MFLVRSVGRSPISEKNWGNFNPFLRVSDLLEIGSKAWNLDLINHLFVPFVPGKILRTPHFSTVDSDRCVLWTETSGLYTVRSAYRLLVERVLDASILVDSWSSRILWCSVMYIRFNHEWNALGASCKKIVNKKYYVILIWF